MRHFKAKISATASVELIAKLKEVNGSIELEDIEDVLEVDDIDDIEVMKEI